MYVCYHVINTIQQAKSLEVITGDAYGTIAGSYAEASRVRRFGHLLLAALICLLVVSELVSLYGKELMRQIGEELGPRTAIYILLIVFRMIYYPLMETVFGATPAKFLPGTRVRSDKLMDDVASARPGSKTEKWLIKHQVTLVTQACRRTKTGSAHNRTMLL